MLTTKDISISQNAINIPFCDMGRVFNLTVSYYVILGVFSMSMANVCLYDVVYQGRFHGHDSRIIHVEPAQSPSSIDDNVNLSNSVRKTYRAFTNVAHYVYV
jgi:hypothetical protein